MKITIETDDTKVNTSDVQPAVDPAKPTDVDGGAPSDANSQTRFGSPPAPSQQAGINAGPPPDWLVEALQNANLSSTADMTVATDLDAGAAPNTGL